MKIEHAIEGSGRHENAAPSFGSDSRSLSELETRLVEVLTSYHQHRAELEALISGPLDAGKGSNP